MNSLNPEHTGDVHDPSEFGINMDTLQGQDAWRLTTTEVIAIGDFSQQEAELVQDLVSKGHAREVAVQTVMYDRLI